MRMIVLVNDATPNEIGQSSALLAWRAAARGHEVFIAGVCDLSVGPDDRPGCLARQLQADPLDPDKDGVGGVDAAVDRDLARACRAPRAALSVKAGDVLLLRTNPARDQRRRWAHDAALSVARVAKAQGALVLNDPEGLSKASSKIYMGHFDPALRPKTLISRDLAEIRAFVAAEAGPTILKPLLGTHGTDVFCVDGPEGSNLRQIVDVLTREGWAMIQQFVPEAVDGDTRLILVDGRLVELGGHPSAVRRVPSADDFRSNVHAGGHSAPATLTPAMRRIVDAVGPRLKADGIFLAGLDVIGEKVIEINAFSPGGLPDLNQFTGLAFDDAIIQAVEARHAAL